MMVNAIEIKVYIFSYELQLFQEHTQILLLDRNEQIRTCWPGAFSLVLDHTGYEFAAVNIIDAVHTHCK
jgi:hypothetical protein